MVKKKAISRKGLSKRLLSKIVGKGLLPYLVSKSTTAASKTSSIEKTNKIDLASKVDNLPTKPALYPESLNPFRAALSEIRLDEDENIKLNRFLERVILAKNIEELNEIVHQVLDSGIRINAPNAEGYSFSNVAIFKLSNNKFAEDEQANIIEKLALSGADFDKHFMQNSEKTIEICNTVQKKVEPQIHERLKILREVAESATIGRTVCNIEVDNKTFFMEFSQNSTVDVGKVFNGARSLGLNKGDLNLGGDILRLGGAELEIKTEKNGKRNYIDVSDNSAFEVTFPTSLGNLNVTVYHNLKNYHQVHVEVNDEKMWHELQKKRRNCRKWLPVWRNVC